MNRRTFRRRATACPTRAGRCGSILVATIVLVSAASAQEPAADRDTLRPFTVAPQLLNSAEIAQLLENQYPADLRARAITGTTVLIVQVGVGGDVRRPSVWETSGYEEFDDVALAVSRKMKFRPAQSNSGPVPVTITVPVEFKLREAAPAPEFIAYDVKPQLRNEAEVNRVLEALYPTGLKQDKIGGRTVLWVYVGTDGHIERVRVMESSGYREFDRAAGLTSRVMEFTPAMADGDPVAVWNQVTVAFLPGGGSSVSP